MLGRQVQCPVCGTILSVPPGYANCFVRCGLCHQRFRLPAHIGLSDQAVADWLQDETQREQHEQERRANAAAQTKQALREATASGKTQVLPAVAGQLRLRRVDAQGAVFEFPADRLLEPRFRCAIPRRCLCCGTRKNLSAHLIVYAPQLADDYSLEAEHAAGQLAVPAERLGGATGAELLKKLPLVPNVPPPGNLPMPYWLCDACNGRGRISGQIRINSNTGKGTCRLFIRDLNCAAAFFQNAGGMSAQSLEAIRTQARVSANNPWNALPTAVQRRLQGWYHPARGEHMLAYVPDRDRARSEDGLYGILVTTRRLIFHTRLNHHQADCDQPLELTLTTTAGRERLRVKCSTWEVQHFTADRDGLGRLRRALAEGKYEATWC